MISVEEKLWLLRALRKIGFFWACSVEEIKKLVPVFIKKEFDKGQEIIHQGEEGDFFFIIGTGKVSIWAEEEEKKEKIVTLDRGDYFGEIALITGKPRNATVTADEHCQLFLLYRSKFEKLLKENAIMQTHFIQAAARRTEERDSFFKKK